jgi:hypothetical protein
MCLLGIRIIGVTTSISSIAPLQLVIFEVVLPGMDNPIGKKQKSILTLFQERMFIVCSTNSAFRIATILGKKKGLRK